MKYMSLVESAQRTETICFIAREIRTKAVAFGGFDY